MGSVKNAFHDEIVTRADERDPDAPAPIQTCAELADQLISDWLRECTDGRVSDHTQMMVRQFALHALLRLGPTPSSQQVEALRELSERATLGEWQVQDGCSWRRIGTRGRDGNVLCPTNHYRDHHPDLAAGKGENAGANLAFIVACVNYVRAALSHTAQTEGDR